MMAKRRRNPPPRKVEINPEKSKADEHAVELVIGLGGIALAAFVGFDQLQSHRGTLESVLIVGLVLLAISILLVAALANRIVRKRRHFLIGSALACIVAGSAILVFPTSTPSENTPAPTMSGSDPSSTADKLLTELTVPDESNTCTAAGLILKPGNNSAAPVPGSFALTPGSQLSLILQSAEPTEIVVTHIKTVVDQRLNLFSGRFVNITPGCQGSPDERYYLANLTDKGGDVSPRATGQARSVTPPLTVSNEDPVIIYIEVPKVTNSVAWHIQVTWVVNGQEKITNMYNKGKEIIASEQAS